MARLGDYVNIKTGKLDANASSENGQYPFFICSVTPLKIDTYSYDCECVLVAGNGDLNVKYYNGKFDAYQRTYIIESKDNMILSVPYLYCFLDGYVEELGRKVFYTHGKPFNMHSEQRPVPPLTRDFCRFIMKEPQESLLSSAFVPHFAEVSLYFPVFIC